MLKGKATTGGADFDLCPAGNHPAVCIGLIDLGTHYECFQGGAEKKVRKVMLLWELEAEVEGKDKRLFVGRDFNIGLNDKGELVYGDKSNIRKLLETWRGRAYNPDEEIDPEAVVGKACLVSIKHKPTQKGKSYAQVDSVGSLPKGMTALKPSKAKVLYSADSDEGAPGEDWLPRVFGEKVENVLQRSLEWGGTGRKEAGGGSREPVGAGVGSGPVDPPPDEDSDNIPF